MPLYEFRYPRCGIQFERLIAYAQKQEVRCPQCGGEVQEVFSGFAVGGTGSSPTPRFT